MLNAFLEEIRNSIDHNLGKEAVRFYNGTEWITISYEQLKAGAKIISEYVKTINKNLKSYILVYLKITGTFPIFILGSLESELGIVCVEEGKENEYLHQYLSEINIAYILSNIKLEKWKHILPMSVTLKNKFVILGEVVSIWSTEKCSEEVGIAPEKTFMYAIRTSGTTGQSKIVQVSHNCIIPNIRDLSEILQIKNSDVISLMTPVTFDPSMVEVLLALFNGSSLSIIDKSVKENPFKIIDILFPSAGGIISVLQITPSILKELMNISSSRNHIFHTTSSLRALVLGGEEFPSSNEFATWNVSPHISVYNIYGITEVSCWASINKVWPSVNLSNDIGKSLSETLLEIVDADENQQGELWIGSKTRISLVGNENYKDVFREGPPVFRPTGDIFKKYNEKLFFVGRKDDIVKRWGVRLCLSEIEKVARLHEDIIDSSCVSIKMTDHIKVALFIVPKNAPYSIQNFHDNLKKHLPKTSWPDKILSLASLPLTNHGKVCKETLRIICSEQEEKKTRETFDKLWEQYTKQKSDGKIDFLSAGGDSFSALQFLNELTSLFGSLPSIFPRRLLERSTPDELWHLIDKNCNETLVFEENFKERRSENKFPLSLNAQFFSDDVNVVKTYLKGRVSSYSSELQENQLCEFNDCELTGLSMDELFKYNLGKCVDASPLGIQFINKRSVVIVGSHSGNIVVLDVNSMQVNSKCTLPDRIESSACISLCGNFYYIGCYDGCLYCICINSGMLVWKYQTNDMIKSTAIIHEGDIIFGSYDKHIYRLSKEGKLKWKTHLKSPILTEVIVDNNNLYCATLGSVAALNSCSGELLWEYQHDPVFSSPSVNKDCLIIATVKGEVQWLSKETGHKEDSFKSQGMVFSSLVKKIINNEEIIIFGCQDDCIYCLKNRKLHWKEALDSKVVSTPFIEPPFPESPKFVVVLSSAGKTYLLNFENGEKICEYSLPGEVFSSPIVLEKKIIVGCRDDNVYFLKINKY